MMCGFSTAFADAPKGIDFGKITYKGKAKAANVFDAARIGRIDKANALLEAGKPARFANSLSDAATRAEESYKPSSEFVNSELHGDMDGPNGELWFYSGKVEYYANVINEYYTEMLPTSFEVTIFNSEMKPVGTLTDTFELKEDEARVRQVEILPVVTQKFFNQDDNYEIAVSVIVNPLPYGIRPYTYIYSLGAPKDSKGDDQPVMVLNRVISDVCDASDANGENIVMTFVTEGNDSDVTDEDFEERYWEYQLGNFISIQSYGPADANGNLTELFNKRITYYQTQGNQEDDAPVMTYLRNGHPAMCVAYYEEVFYNPFGMAEDMSQRLPNNLVIELYELENPAQGFSLKQTTKIPMAKPDVENVVASYFGVGSFGYTDDIMYGEDGKASFIITRSDYIPSTDSETEAYYVYDANGNQTHVLAEAAVSHSRLTDIPGFNPMEIFITYNNAGEYIFNFTDMKTFKTELSINYGLIAEDSDEPDYMMANLDRTKVGDSFMYVAEMRTPEYDEFNDINYMRVAWITREGQLDHFDYVNMGNLVNYATLFINGEVLNENYFHYGPEREYMMLIKRAFSNESSKTEEQLLIAQAKSDSYPLGQDILLLRPHDEYGNLATIVPYVDPNRLAVTYAKTEGYNTTYTTVYYDLPFNGTSGVNKIENGAASSFVFDGTTVSLPGENIEIFNLQGVRVAAGFGSACLSGLSTGVYFVRAAGQTAKIIVK